MGSCKRQPGRQAEAYCSPELQTRRQRRLEPGEAQAGSLRGLRRVLALCARVAFHWQLWSRPGCIGPSAKLQWPRRVRRAVPHVGKSDERAGACPASIGPSLRLVRPLRARPAPQREAALAQCCERIKRKKEFLCCGEVFAIRSCPNDILIGVSVRWSIRSQEFLARIEATGLASFYIQWYLLCSFQIDCEEGLVESSFAFSV